MTACTLTLTAVEGAPAPVATLQTEEAATPVPGVMQRALLALLADGGWFTSEEVCIHLWGRPDWTRRRDACIVRFAQARWRVNEAARRAGGREILDLEPILGQPRNARLYRVRLKPEVTVRKIAQ